MSLKPPKPKFEKIPKYKPQWINGVISKIEYDPAHKRNFKGQIKESPCVRFVFELEGCEFQHKSRWMSFMYSEKSDLYTKYLIELVEGAQPNMDFSIDELEGMEVKTMWKQDGDYDVLEMICPANGKLKPTDVPENVHDDSKNEPVIDEPTE